jgi:hypothetical protein
MILRPAIILALLLAPPASAAQDVEALRNMVAALNNADEVAMYQSAIAGCLLGQGDSAATAQIFASAGWTVAEDEPGLNYISGPNPEVYVLAATDGTFCATYAETIGTTPAIGSLQAVGKSAGFSEEGTTGEIGCFALQLTSAIVAEVTSSGNDPVCEDPNTSSVRITFAN